MISVLLCVVMFSLNADESLQSVEKIIVERSVFEKKASHIRSDQKYRLQNVEYVFNSDDTLYSIVVTDYNEKKTKAAYNHLVMKHGVEKERSERNGDISLVWFPDNSRGFPYWIIYRYNESSARVVITIIKKLKKY